MYLRTLPESASLAYRSVLADVTHPVCKLSDHAPMSIEFKFAADPNMLVERSRTLCEHVVPSDCETRCIAPISIKKIDPVKFSKCLSDIEPPPLDLDAHDIALPFAECMYSVASRSKAPPIRPTKLDPEKSRWQRIMACEDSKTL